MPHPVSCRRRLRRASEQAGTRMKTRYSGWAYIKSALGASLNKERHVPVPRYARRSLVCMIYSSCICGPIGVAVLLHPAGLFFGFIAGGLLGPFVCWTLAASNLRRSLLWTMLIVCLVLAAGHLWLGRLTPSRGIEVMLWVYLGSCLTAPIWAPRPRSPKPGHCQRCGYKREGLLSTEPCPECGADPDQNRVAS